MTLEQLYCSIGSESDYLDVLRRFTGEALVKRFVIKFLQDPSLVLPLLRRLLRKAMQRKPFVRRIRLREFA